MHYRIHYKDGSTKDEVLTKELVARLKTNDLTIERIELINTIILKNRRYSSENTSSLHPILIKESNPDGKWVFEINSKVDYPITVYILNYEFLVDPGCQITRILWCEYQPYISSVKNNITKENVHYTIARVVNNEESVRKGQFLCNFVTFLSVVWIFFLLLSSGMLVVSIISLDTCKVVCNNTFIIVSWSLFGILFLITLIWFFFNVLVYCVAQKKMKEKDMKYYHY